MAAVATSEISCGVSSFHFLYAVDLNTARTEHKWQRLAHRSAVCCVSHGYNLMQLLNGASETAREAHCEAHECVSAAAAAAANCAM
jgi:hypothetical protein